MSPLRDSARVLLPLQGFDEGDDPLIGLRRGFWCPREASARVPVFVGGGFGERRREGKEKGET